MLTAQLDHLLAVDVPTFIAAYLGDLPPAELARLSLAEMIEYARGHFARSSSLGYRPAASTIGAAIDAAQRYPREFGLDRWPWQFSESGPISVGWLATSDGPRRPIGPLFTTQLAGGLLNVGCIVPNNRRSDPASAPSSLGDQTINATIYRIIGGDLVELQTVAANTDTERAAFFQIGPFEIGEQLALTVKTQVDQLGWSFPSPLQIATISAV